MTTRAHRNVHPETQNASLPAGDPNPSPLASGALDATVKEAMALVDDVTTRLERVAVGAPVDRQRRLKARKGWEPIVHTIGTLARRSNLVPPGIDLDAITTRVDQIAALGPLEAAVSKLYDRLVNARLAFSTEAYDGSLELYALLQRRALGDPELAAGLQPVADFFANRHKSVAADKPTKLEARGEKLDKRATRLAAHARFDSAPDAPVATAPAVASAASNGIANGVAHGAVLNGIATTGGGSG
jgi:hypothetical protein